MKKKIQQNLETWSAMLSNNNDLLLRAILQWTRTFSALKQNLLWKRTPSSNPFEFIKYFIEVLSILNHEVFFYFISYLSTERLKCNNVFFLYISKFGGSKTSTSCFHLSPLSLLHRSTYSSSIYVHMWIQLKFMMVLLL